MTPAEIREALAALHWTQRGFAAALGVQERQVRRWASGEYLLPPAIAEWLRQAAAWHNANPPPAR